MPFPYLGEDRELNETARLAAPGRFVQLQDGMTHYELAGPDTGPVIVLVHGFSTPSYIFEPTFDFLSNAGFRVLRYDLFGRGWSDRPRLPNNMTFFTRQLQDLLAALGIDSPIQLVGLSMGGPITAAFTVQHPAQVAGNVLIDPAGVRETAPGILKALALPALGEIVLGIFGGEGLVKNVASDLFGPALAEQFQERYREQMRFAGFKRSILSTLRSGMLGSVRNTYRALGLLGKPTLLLWGRKDHAVPLSHSTELLKLVPQAEFHVIEQASHIPHYERPEEVNPILLDFLSRP